VPAALTQHPGVTHVVLRRAAVEPAGDVVEAAVAREATDTVVASLCPPAAGAVLAEWDICIQSVAQLSTNLVGVVAAAALVLALGNRRGRPRDLGRPPANG
jgi:hypothetical protein